MSKEELEKENEILKHRLNDMVFGDDYELGARYLRKIGYIGFDEERKVYINKHNNEPFFHKDEKEKDYYIPDEELDEYTKQLEYQLQQKENIIKEVREKVDNFDVFKEFTFPLMKRDEEQQVKSSIDYEWRKSIKEPILNILDKGE